MKDQVTPTAEAALADLRKLAAAPLLIDIKGVPHVVMPEGFELEAPDLEKLLPEPTRTRRQIAANDIAGFIAYAKDWKSERTSLFCGGVDKPLLEARLDDHKPDKPSHVSHVLTFACPRTPEYLAWTASSKKKFGQIDFAEFIENNIRDIIKPEGAALLASVLNFQDHRSAQFSSAARLADGGIEFQYADKTAGKVVFPESFDIAVAVFEGQQARYTIRAKTRYRIEAGALLLWYELDRPDLTLRKAYADLIESVEKEVGIAVYRAL